MDQQREERLIDQERRRLRDRGLRGEHRLDVAGEGARVRQDVELRHVLPARLADVPHVAARRGLRTGLRRGHVQAGAALDDLLPHIGALARDEPLAGAIGGDRHAAQRRVRSRKDRVRCAKQLDALSHRHPERVALDRGAVLATLSRLRREGHRRTPHRRGGLRAPERLLEQRADPGHARRAIRRGKAPGTAGDDPDADATIAIVVDALELAVLHRDRLALAFDGSGVRVRRAATRGPVHGLREAAIFEHRVQARLGRNGARSG